MKFNIIPITIIPLTILGCGCAGSDNSTTHQTSMSDNQHIEQEVEQISQVTHCELAIEHIKGVVQSHELLMEYQGEWSRLYVVNGFPYEWVSLAFPINSIPFDTSEVDMFIKVEVDHDRNKCTCTGDVTYNSHTITTSLTQTPWCN